MALSAKKNSTSMNKAVALLQVLFRTETVSDTGQWRGSDTRARHCDRRGTRLKARGDLRR